MKLDLELKDGQLSFCVSELWDLLTDDQKKQMAKSMVWEADVLDDLINAIINDEIVTSSFDYQTYGARKRILESLGVMERNHFRSLLSEMKSQKDTSDEYSKAYFRLYHAWPDEHLDRRPNGPEFKHGSSWPSEEKIDSEMEARK